MQKQYTYIEHIRLRPEMCVPVYPARTLFQWLLAEFTDLHLASNPPHPPPPAPAEGPLRLVETHSRRP